MSGALFFSYISLDFSRLLFFSPSYFIPYISVIHEVCKRKEKENVKKRKKERTQKVNIYIYVHMYNLEKIHTTWLQKERLESKVARAQRRQTERAD